MNTDVLTYEIADFSEMLKVFVLEEIVKYLFNVFCAGFLAPGINLLSCNA